MSNYNWNYPTTIWVGKDRINDLYLACSNLKIQNPLFVTDKDLINLPMVKEVISKIKNRIDNIVVFSDFSGNPFGENVEEGVIEFKKNNCDGVIAFGGGSGLDVGKAIAFMSAQTRPIWDFEDIGDYWKRANNENIPPIIAIPTTAGTGSETGRASAIINKETGVKKIIFHPKFLPSIVILDPILTKDLSPRLTGATGMDALAHNLEAFCAPGFHPMADGIAIEGMKLIKKSLLNAVHNGNDLDARSDLLAAASMGSTAFQKGLGAIHSLSHPLNAKFNIHHGLSNAIFMPYVLTFNREAIEERIISICDYLNLSKSFNSFLEWILNLRKELEIPHKLSDVIDINKLDIDELSEMALNDPSTASNPKTLTISDMKIIYKNSISGELFK
ncbi:iron-containing alcohol dehydrogenase [Candidatus Pelagibacter sp.]|nr:iron-containing alcohol dehydrogenase [Candidatus Pelagibacter sp.]